MLLPETSSGVNNKQPKQANTELKSKWMLPPGINSGNSNNKMQDSQDSTELKSKSMQQLETSSGNNSNQDRPVLRRLPLK